MAAKKGITDEQTRETANLSVREASQVLGVRPNAMWEHRKRLGLPPAHRPGEQIDRRNHSQMIVSDAQIRRTAHLRLAEAAWVLEVSASTVWRRRRYLGIESGWRLWYHRRGAAGARTPKVKRNR